MYYHGVINGLVDKKILSILQDREIRSASKRNSVNSVGFNENDFISLCEYMGEEVYKNYPNNAFSKYIVGNFCFVIADDIDVQKPEFIENASTMDRFALMKLRIEHPEKRFSDIIDERQAHESVPFDKIVAIGIPYKKMPTVSNLIKLSAFTYFTPSEYVEFIGEVERQAASLGIPVVDSSSPEFALTFEENKNVKK